MADFEPAQDAAEYHYKLDALTKAWQICEWEFFETQFGTNPIADPRMGGFGYEGMNGVFHDGPAVTSEKQLKYG
ncbi:hypothetical protein CROQUDRAFT_108605 [Cronartium quercuum f. sp. fusiforme G11]|uniref:Uncharacterized protein n=1 Tax=Cronartium quercuum f. sp. fusiforme G11 TaxID=708437 RepID=A0A9P6NE20_9BASI|nr:hypothetical protein CROQUDRAFT_108605 [Cronartium quercuum f. sp. fusiforme G11]